MEKLVKLLGLEPKKGDFGVEIECEGNGLKIVSNDEWDSKVDNSLRGNFPDSAIEWVFKEPLSLSQSIRALNNLVNIQKKANAKPLFSFRTSTHVHVNMQEATEDQLCAMIYTYCIIEELLVNFAGPRRKANRFCLSINDGEGVLDYFNHVFQIGAPGLRVNENEVRYAALNIASLRKFGSLEVRLLHGTLDMDILSSWLISLSTLREFAFKMENPRNVHDFFISEGPKSFIKNVFPDTYKELMFKDWEDAVNRNFSITLELVHTFVSSEERKVKKKPEPEYQLIIDELPRAAAIQEQPPRPRDAVGRFIPGVAFDPFMNRWVRYDERRQMVVAV